MKVRKAVITAAGRNQRDLPLQTLIDRDGIEKPVLAILVEQAVSCSVDDVCIVVFPGDEARYAQALGPAGSQVRFIPQERPLGYGYAVWTARSFTGDEPFLHLVGDHLYVEPDRDRCAARIVRLAETESCSVSAVQATRESLLPLYGVVGGRRLPGHDRVYRIETVAEKPTPTEAEQRLLVPGIRAGHYLCFFGTHVLTPTVMDILGGKHAENPDSRLTLSAALAGLARHEQYLAVEAPGRRYDIGTRYGLTVAQLALALGGPDRSEILARIVELLADTEVTAAAVGSTR